MPLKSRRANGDGSIFFDKSKRLYYGRVSINHKRRKTAGCVVKGEAKMLLDQLKLGIANGRVSLDPDKSTVGQYLERWIGSLEVAASTKLRYHSSIRCHVLSNIDFSKTRVVELDSYIVIDFLGELRSRESASTVRKVQTTLRSAFTGLVHPYGTTLQNNPFVIPKQQRVKYKPVDRGHPFSVDKESAFLDGCKDDPLNALYVLALDSGARQGEIFALKWSDVTFASRTVQIAHSLTDTAEGVCLGETKNRQRRSLIVSQMTADALKKHYEAQLAIGGVGILVFPNANGGYMSRQNFNRRPFARALKRAAEISGLDFAGHTFHDLRHTMASLLLAEGESIARVSQRLGHSKVSTTLDYYAHYLPQDEDRPANRFDTRRSPMGSPIMYSAL